MIHYHGGPITPERAGLYAWHRRHALISWLRPDHLYLAQRVCQSYILDNGAFSAWKSEKTVDWEDYYEWTAGILNHPACDWAIIPDVIEGTESENDALIQEWPHGHRGVPVWHMNESVDRLIQLANDWPRIAIGSCGEYDVSSPLKCVDRLKEVLPHILDDNGHPITKLHGLRMLNPLITQEIPLSSGDSSNVARNIGIDRDWKNGPRTKESRALIILERLESVFTPGALELDGKIDSEEGS